MMKLFKKRIPIINATDAHLVMHSLGGDRYAFCEIVSRYQNLLCSVAYSAIGDVKQSEDLAQEAFIEAWKKLDTLRDPEKLKSWLCGILRFKVSHFRRKEENQPIKHASELDEYSDQTKINTELDNSMIDEQEQALLWRTLNTMDETYREPLVLFYREQQSIERVARELDLSESTVKQRLSRGRKLLKTAMSTFVEDALEKSKPGVAFTSTIFTIISGLAPPAKTAAFSASAFKTGSFFKLSSVLTFLAVFSGFISSYFGVRAGLDQSRTVNERRLVIKSVVLFFTVAFLFVVAMLGLKHYVYANQESAKMMAILAQLVVLAFVACYLYLAIAMVVAQKTLRQHERLFHPEAFLHESDQTSSKQREYISKLSLFGIPLVHIQFSIPEQNDKAAFGWIAGGSYARGLLFAWGGVAIAPISVGIISVGVLSIGAIGVGLFSMGTVAIGFIAFGASAIGFKAYSSLSSLGWESALSGGFSIAKEGAIGAIAFAEQANTEFAADIVKLQLFEEHFHWALAILAFMVIVPAMYYAQQVRKRMKATKHD
ncbi:sigma-70 family RNA polymerase sigma factor [Thalassotalea sp. 1_MG-2023]|uniref:sigma-70 family RNA polymerase sigma factor n=1 Tax=Thalassotalea sp. 1_MG-2023 TaxID=3062680 RepID=UPI0026E2C0A6|nr:sigma-70 family RNA polymerase sigma factor [Thalassotalea sp. 1_MG-2023]MDO6426077.1 sigma-70 family RNA polymerase sigma factor [Thalassotalea sp. 1_MG-2023]